MIGYSGRLSPLKPMTTLHFYFPPLLPFPPLPFLSFPFRSLSLQPFAFPLRCSPTPNPAQVSGGALYRPKHSKLPSPAANAF